MSTTDGAGVSNARRGFSLAFLCVAVIVIVMDGSIVNVVLPTLGRLLPGATFSRLQWIVDSYILTFASLLLCAGGVADRIGRKRMLLAGLAAFACFSVIAAFSMTSWHLILMRSLMGVGAAMIFPSTLAIITDIYPDQAQRRNAIAIWAGSSGLGVALGPMVGGFLADHFHWGSVFLVNVPLIVIAFLGVRATAPESWDPRVAPLDLTGGAMAMLGVLLVVWGLIEAPARGWASFPTLGSLLGGAVCLGAFVAWEATSDAPMLDMRYFLDRCFTGGCVAIASAFFGLFGFVFLVTQYFQFVRGYGALSTGIRTAPFAGFILLGSLMAANQARRMGTRTIVASGLALMACGFAWTTGVTQVTTYAGMVMRMGVLGVGLGLVNAGATSAIMAVVPTGRAGTGSSVNDTLREVGGTLGVAGIGSVFNARYRGGLNDTLMHAPIPQPVREMLRTSVAAGAEVVAGVEQIAGPAAADSLRDAVNGAFLDGFRVGCWLACGMATAGLVSVLLLIPAKTAKCAGHSAGPIACGEK